jgi:hydroxymethylglutaryl-CoA reductase
MLFRNDGALKVKSIEMSGAPPLVIACSSAKGLTKDVVAGVRSRREQSQEHYDAIFMQMDQLSLAGAAALECGNFDELGRLMNICHGLLAAIEVSTAELDAMVSLVRSAGAIGSKLTGAGGGGSIVALCPDRIDAVSAALEASGFRTLQLHGEGTRSE